MLKSWEVSLIDSVERKNRRIKELEQELDMKKDDYDSLKIIYNELTEGLNKALTEKSDAIMMMSLYKVLLQRLIRMCISSMSHDGWYNPEIYGICKTLKVSDEEYTFYCECLEDDFERISTDGLPDDSEEPDE